MNRIKKLFSMLFGFILFFFFCSCDPARLYKGERKDLLTVAINSLLEADGTSFKKDVILEVKEQDDYGREMFFYEERRILSTYSLIISQKTENEYVYYYEDYNFISSADENFSKEEIDKLKEWNDWNKPLNEKKLLKMKVSSKKIIPQISSKEEKILENLAETLVQKEANLLKAEYSSPNTIKYFISDCYNRKIYVQGMTLSVLKSDLKDKEDSYHYETENYKCYYKYYVILVQPDFTYDENSIMEITDFYNYQDDLKVLKEKNNWNKIFADNE